MVYEGRPGVVDGNLAASEVRGKPRVVLLDVVTVCYFDNLEDSISGEDQPYSPVDVTHDQPARALFVGPLREGMHAVRVRS